MGRWYLVNYIYRCGTWWEVGKLTYMAAALPREKISCFFLSGVDRYALRLDSADKLCPGLHNGSYGYDLLV